MIQINETRREGLKEMTTNDLKGHGIQSLELGLDILKKIADQDKPLTITEIANLCGMSKSKLHRYLTSFCRCGFLAKQDDLRYSLGTELILLGLKTSEKLDVKEISGPYLTALRERLNETVALAIWGENGPFFLRWEESNRAVNLGIRAGSQVSVTRSAPGKLFAAYLPQSRTLELVKRELPNGELEQAAFYNEMEEVKRKGYAVTQGTLIPGISAISCPVFGQNGEIIAAITVVGLIDTLDVSENSETIPIIMEQCLSLSHSLGYQKKFSYV
ncbi:IclR family transcriptional regulator [Paenibacillus sp. JMULE4]|nr:IclR family transcriptional regulator [Paenibacillus sp. JMULE4]